MSELDNKSAADVRGWNRAE